MKNDELEILKDWRFVPIDYGSKAPKEKDWQKKHRSLAQIPQDKNIGVILGEASNGILAIDFDGPWSWEYWIENVCIPFDKIDTVTWTSNKVGRCQMAFQVPKEFWKFMPNKFEVSGPLGDDGKPQQLEVRWGNDISGCQSVLPPSLHPDNKIDPNINYTWLRKPSEVLIQECPADLLEWIINYKKEENYIPEEVDVPKSTPDEVAELAEELKKYYPQLPYDTWIRVTWAFCNEIGYDDGIMIMKYHYPESKRDEYKSLSRARPKGRKCTIGTIKKMINDKKGTKSVPKLHDDLFQNNAWKLI